MVNIPSIEKTDDYIFRAELKKGATREADEPVNLVTFEHFAGAAGVLHSVDFVTHRDGQRANDLEFQSFEHHVTSPEIAFVRLKFLDLTSAVIDHDYLVTVILRYLV
jgi:hypothetical protein